MLQESCIVRTVLGTTFSEQMVSVCFPIQLIISDVHLHNVLKKDLPGRLVSGRLTSRQAVRYVTVKAGRICKEKLRGEMWTDFTHQLVYYGVERFCPERNLLHFDSGCEIFSFFFYIVNHMW